MKTELIEALANGLKENAEQGSGSGHRGWGIFVRSAEPSQLRKDSRSSLA